MYLERIKQLRVENALSSKEVCQFLNISACTYSNYESGAKKPKTHDVIKLAAYYGVSVDYLVGLTNVKTPYPKQKT